MNTEEARMALKTLDERLESVKLTCVYALNDLEDVKREFKEGKSTEEDVRYYNLRAGFAMEILRELGYEVDSYFCGRAILKAVVE